MTPLNLLVKILVLFIIIFPKGGVKLGGIPITWGYSIVEILTILLLPFAIIKMQFVTLSKKDLYVYISLLAYQVPLIVVLCFNGAEDFGFLASLIVNYILFPWTFLAIFSPYFTRIDTDEMLRFVTSGITFIAVFGLILFVYKFVTGEFFEIPYLSVNSGDVGALSEKHINRGGIFKLISTYNNGNIYGVCVLMLLPLYCGLQTSVLKKSLVKLSLLLTLSRTVWVGLILYEILSRALKSEKKIRLKDVFLLFFSFFVFVISFIYVIDLLGWDAKFLFDPNLGGRLGGESLDFQLVASQPFTVISEMTAKSFAEQFGVLIALLVYIGLSAPLITFFICNPLRTLWQKDVCLGLFLYLIVSQVEGASLFIPVMAIYWFLCSLLRLDAKNNCKSV